jgi:hypothetical protein
MSFVKIFALLVGITFLTLFIFCYFEVGSEMAKGINREGLVELRPGMTEEEILQLIGPPLDREPRSYGENSQRGNYTRWIYGKPGFCQGGLEIAVGVENGKLVAVGVELYDIGVYRCNKERCPVVWNEEALELLPSRPQRSTTSRRDL